MTKATPTTGWSYDGNEVRIGEKPNSADNIIFIDDDNISGAEDGSLDNPYKTIQEGIDLAYGDDYVYVLAGTYNEVITAKDGHDM